MTKIAVRPEYPPTYPSSNDLSSHSQQARRAWVSNGGLPIPTTDPKAGTDQYYQKAGEGHADVAKSKTNNKGMLKADAKSIGSKVFDSGQDVVGFVKKFDPQNTSGTIPFALDLIKQIQTGSGVNKILTDVVGQGMGGLISKFTSLIKQGLPGEAQKLADLIQQGMQLKQRVEQLTSSATSTPDPQILATLQQQLNEIEQQITNLNSNSSV